VRKVLDCLPKKPVPRLTLMSNFGDRARPSAPSIRSGGERVLARRARATVRKFDHVPSPYASHPALPLLDPGEEMWLSTLAEFLNL